MSFVTITMDFVTYTQMVQGGIQSSFVASAVIFRNTMRSVRLPNKASIFRAELYAITLTMDLIESACNQTIQTRIGSRLQNSK